MVTNEPSIESSIHGRWEVSPDALGAFRYRLIAEARSLRATSFWLQVMPSNEPAIGLYTKAGFTDVHHYSYFAKSN